MREYQSGVDLIKAPPIPNADRIVMDTGVPRMSGLDVTKALRERGVTMPIVALTAYSNQSDVDAHREASMNGFVSKPVSEDILMDVIEKVLSGESWVA